MKTIASIALALALAGCAGPAYRPLVDMRGTNLTQYEKDLYECQRYAQQVAGAAEGAMGGAIAGALFGAVIAAVVGHGVSRNQMAGLGAVSGAASGGVQGETNQRDVIRRCMAGRGFSVLR